MLATQSEEVSAIRGTREPQELQELMDSMDAAEQPVCQDLTEGALDATMRETQDETLQMGVQDHVVYQGVVESRDRRVLQAGSLVRVRDIQE